MDFCGCRRWLYPLILAGLPSVVSAQDRTVAETVARPIGSPGDWFRYSDYPAQALRAGESGKVVFVVDIDPAGVPTRCSIRESSGSANLDSGTCALAMSCARFQPARDGIGKAVAGTFSAPVRWAAAGPGGSHPVQIDVATTQFRDIDVVTTVILDSDGRIVKCDTTQSTPPVSSDSCSDFPVGHQMGPRTVRNGKPVGGRIVKRTTMQTIFD